jgi:uncharacterized protein (TIGR02118 family)
MPYAQIYGRNTTLGRSRHFRLKHIDDPWQAVYQIVWISLHRPPLVRRIDSTEKTGFLLFWCVDDQETHLPMMRRFVGERLKGFWLDTGVSAPNLPAPYAYIPTLLFESLEEMQAAMAEQGAALASDISNYTNAQPVVQVSETSQ